MNPPENPKQSQARAALKSYNAPLLQNPAHYDYRLTWPAQQAAVCCIAGQWQRNEAGEIEAWYTAEQLREVLETMQECERVTR